MDRMKINVGGTMFEILRNELLRYPDTLLGALCTKGRCNYDEQSVLFFSRNPEMFNDILDFYRRGKIHFSSGNCGAAIHDEIDFWQLPLDAICECCVQEYFRYEKEMEQIRVLKAAFEESDLSYDTKQVLRSRRVYVLNAIWKFLDQPYSSKFAQVFNVMFLLVVIMSALSFILSTNKEFRNELIDFNTLVFLVKHSDTVFFKDINLNNSKEVLMSTSETKEVLRDIDLACAIFFSLEYLLHFLTCPQKCKFFTFALNVVDTFLFFDTICVYIIEEFMDELTKDLLNFYLVMKCLTSFRLFRLFRIMKVFSGFRVLILALKDSLKELLLLFVSFLIASIYFAFIVYFAEFHTEDSFVNLQIGIWWSIVTMTTVGYGDVYPKSGLGYAVGTLCAFCGVIIIALPIAVVASKFNNFYHKNKAREDMKNLKEKYMKRSACKSSKVFPEEKMKRLF